MVVNETKLIVINFIPFWNNMKVTLFYIHESFLRNAQRKRLQILTFSTANKLGSLICSIRLILDYVT